MDLTAVRNRLERVLRRAEGKQYTIRRIADRTGFHPENVRRWVKGGTGPSLAFVIRVCEVYGVSANFLLFGTAPIFSEQKTRRVVRDHMQELLKEILDDLDWPGSEETATDKSRVPDHSGVDAPTEPVHDHEPPVPVVRTTNLRARKVSSNGTRSG